MAVLPNGRDAVRCDGDGGATNGDSAGDDDATDTLPRQPLHDDGGGRTVFLSGSSDGSW